MTFNKRLILLRESRALDQTQLAKALGFCSRSAVSLWELGTRRPPTWKLQMIADFFNVKVDYLLGNTDDSTPGTKLPNPTEDDKAKAETLAEQLQDPAKMRNSPAYQKMLDAGWTEERIEEFADFVISMAAQKKPPS